MNIYRDLVGNDCITAEYCHISFDKLALIEKVTVILITSKPQFHFIHSLKVLRHRCSLPQSLPF